MMWLVFVLGVGLVLALWGVTLSWRDIRDLTANQTVLFEERNRLQGQLDELRSTVDGLQEVHDYGRRRLGYVEEP